MICLCRRQNRFSCGMETEWCEVYGDQPSGGNGTWVRWQKKTGLKTGGPFTGMVCTALE